MLALTQNDYRKARGVTGLELSEAARLMGQKPKQRRYERTCPVCGKTFAATARGVFCSAQCRTTYHNRQAAAKRAEAKEGSEALPAGEGEGLS